MSAMCQSRPNRTAANDALYSITSSTRNDPSADRALDVSFRWRPGIQPVSQGRKVMKTVHSIIAVLGLACVLPAAVDAATTDPEVVLYRFPGVLDNGGGTGSGTATAFHCTNYSGVP